MKIILNIAEQKLSKYLGQKRFENARKKNKPNMKIGGQSNYETDLNSIGAEIAFCKMFNLYPDTETDLNDLPVFDAITRQGRLVDIKSTKYENGHLLVAPWKDKNNVDYYCLMVGDFPKYRFCGMISSNELFNLPKKDFGHGEGFAASQGQLCFDDVF